MNEYVYSENEAVRLGNPIALEPDSLPCDRIGCASSGRWLIPGASLCEECAAEFGFGSRDTYDVPVQELIGDDRWRRARRDEYVERLRFGYPPLSRNARRDRLLDRFASRRVDEIFGEA